MSRAIQTSGEHRPPARYRLQHQIAIDRRTHTVRFCGLAIDGNQSRPAVLPVGQHANQYVRRLPRGCRRHAGCCRPRACAERPRNGQWIQ